MRTFDPAALGFRGRSANISQTDPMVQASLGINIPVTSLVLGMPTRQTFLGDMLFRKIPVPWNFKYPKYDLSAHARKDARRGWSSEIQSSDVTLDMIPGSLQRYTWETFSDADVLAIAAESQGLLGAPSISLQRRKQILSERVVRLSIEYDRSVVALASASYSSSPDLDDTLSSGSEWNDATNGDSRTSVRSMASRVAAANGGLAISDIDVYLTTASFEAAQDDPLFIARRVYGSVNAAVAADLAAYWGVGAVYVSDATYTTDGATVTSMYGDVAIFRVSRNLTGFDTSEAGQLDSFCAFTWQGAQGALQPYYENSNTSWHFPWQSYEMQAQVNTLAAGIIRNCKG